MKSPDPSGPAVGGMAEQLLAQHLIALGDDELVLAHRDSEWTGHAPILEEDIAFGNIALDELGHAISWYRVVAELLGEDPASYPDELAYRRPAAQFRNVQLVELPNGDWANTIVRQYLFDACEQLRLEALASSAHAGVAEVAGKLRTEEIYHQRHLKAWVLRLGQGTEESNQRMQRAVDVLYPYALQLFVPDPQQSELAAEQLMPDPSALGQAWREQVDSHLQRSGLMVHSGATPPAGSRSEHSEHLQPLVDELQQVTRAHAGARW